jgi:hypothetical protein
VLGNVPTARGTRVKPQETPVNEARIVLTRSAASVGIVTIERIHTDKILDFLTCEFSKITCVFNKDVTFSDRKGGTFDTILSVFVCVYHPLII